VVDGVPQAVVVRGPGDVVIARARTGGGGGTWSCAYYLGAVGDVVGDPGALNEPVVPEPGQYVALHCFGPDGGLVYTEALYYDPANPLGGIAAARRAAELARQQLDPSPPDLTMSPPASSFQLVGVPSWFWVPDWGPVQASATLAGVTSTVTATPVELTIDAGDGTTVTCGGPGTAYDPGAPAAQTSDCTHTYRVGSRARPGGSYEVSATVTYEVAWTATTGEGGPLESIWRTTTGSVRVDEAQAVLD
jgi:hypothetical protein